MAFVNLSITELFFVIIVLFEMSSLRDRFRAFFYSEKKPTKIAFVMIEKWNATYYGHIEFDIHIGSWFLAVLVIHIWAIETNCWCIMNSTIYTLWYRKISKQTARTTLSSNIHYVHDLHTEIKSGQRFVDLLQTHRQMKKKSFETIIIHSILSHVHLL